MMSQYKVLGTISRANVRLRGVFGLPFFAVKENLFPHRLTKVTLQSDAVPVELFTNVHTKVYIQYL